MSAPPYMRLYWGDYHRDTGHLNRGEHGAYLMLLSAMWARDGRLPNDDAALAKFALCTAAEWAEIKPTILAFFRVSRGKLTHKRIAAELAKYENTLCKRKEAGRRGGLSSHGKDRENPEANAKQTGSKSPHNQNHNQIDTEAKASAVADPSANPDKAAWDLAKVLLWNREQLNSDKAGSFFGGLLAKNGLEARDLLPAILAAQVNETAKPREYLTRAASGIAKRREPSAPAKRVGFV